MAYSIACSCGNQVEVHETQAGAWATCGCGKSVAVPSLRELRKPPPSAPASGIRDALPAPAGGDTYLRESATPNEASAEPENGEPTQAVYNYAAQRLVNDIPPAQVRRELMG